MKKFALFLIILLAIVFFRSNDPAKDPEKEVISTLFLIEEQIKMCNPWLSVNCERGPLYDDLIPFCQHPTKLDSFGSKKFSPVSFAFFTIYEPLKISGKEAMLNMINMLESIDLYFQYEADHFFLCETTTELETVY